MLNTVLVFLLLTSFFAPTGTETARPSRGLQVTDSRNLMWCSARSDQTIYYSAWFRYTPSRVDEHRAKFQKDTQANYNLKTLDPPTCYSFPEPGSASEALESNVKTQKKAGYKIVTTGWMPQ